MIAITTPPETTKDLAQLFLINEARMGNNKVVMRILKDYQDALCPEDFLSKYNTILELNIARKVLELAGDE